MQVNSGRGDVTSSARVLLVVPVPTERIGALRHDYRPAPLGLASIAASLLANGIDVRIFDGIQTPSVEDLRTLVRSYQPRFVGVTSYTHDIDAAHRTATTVKDMDAGIITIIGGIHATCLPVETLAEFANFDIAVVGEGERVLQDIVEADGATSLLQTIKGIAFRRDGRIMSCLLYTSPSPRD